MVVLRKLKLKIIMRYNDCVIGNEFDYLIYEIDIKDVYLNFLIVDD